MEPILTLLFTAGRQAKATLRLSQLIGLSLILAACANQGLVPQREAGKRPDQPQPSKVDLPAPRPATPVVPVEPQPPSIRSQAKRPAAPPAVQSIERRALKQLKVGDIEAAIISAERGLRIARNTSGLLWVLARAYELQHNAEQAEAFAQQGLRYSQGNRRREFERLLGRLSN